MDEEKLKIIVSAGEGFTTEFKQIFNWSNGEARVKYIKSIVGLSNHNGGNLIFGIEDGTNKIVGIEDEFDKLDQSHITTEINNYFTPTIIWNRSSLIIDGKKIGIINVQKRKSIPSVCKKDYPKILSESDIYFRYQSQTTKIKFGDLLMMFDEIRNSDELDFRKETRKVENKPHLTVQTGFSGNELTLRIFNRDHRAIIKEVVPLEGNTVNLITQIKEAGITIDAEQSFQIVGRTLAGAMYVPCHIKIIYTDRYGIKYFQEFHKGPFVQNFVFTDPVKIAE